MLTLLIGLFLFIHPQARSAEQTEHFTIRHDKTIPAKVVRAIGKALEAEYDRASPALGIALSRKVPVILYTSELRYKADSRSLAFTDGDAKAGSIHLSYPALKKDRDAWDGLFARVVAKALIAEVVYCPPWLADAYGLRAGGQTHRFADPARVAIASFGDLFEEYNRAERPKDVKEVFAKLGFTIDFLVDRFGEKKVRETFAQFRTGKDAEEIFTTTFGEPVRQTEEAWAAALRASARR